MRAAAALLLLALALLRPLAGGAHALDPAYLELSALEGGQWRVTWRVPDVSGRPMPLGLALPASCADTAPPPPAFDGRGWSTGFLLACPEGLAGRIGITGLEITGTDALLRYETAPGAAQTRRLTAAAPMAEILAEPAPLAVLASYAGLGTTHILEGADHLLFVLALLFLVRDPRRLLWTVTAFTLAHSLTLAAASLGWLRLPPPPVEAVIALSIVILAAELAKPPARRDPLATRFPAAIAFGFGLVHGLGFAGALREIGLPQSDVPLALLGFNLGVEAGQLIFIAAMLAIGALARRLVPALAARGPAVAKTASYAIGCTAAFWVIERVSGF
ncbi:HupE/UreJ family protein [Poseidonocella sp. HB161398]|uniref:HupE/UreJ family protein n=1 Tax=Poseidonocella sp. HB161398 TaxID=2320855 RepID=UPI001F1017FA|nr:HupE/UreJ family protein [Poseidonocella sp. HB161398]